MTSITRLFEAQIEWANLKADECIWIPCMMCGSPTYEAQASLTINWVEFFVVKCSSCGLTWRNPMPNPEFLASLYSDHYYNVLEHAPDLIYQVGIADYKNEDQNRRSEIADNEVRNWQKKGFEPFDVANEQKRLLEIGGGRGYLQRAASELGWNTVGIEISEHGIKAATDKGLVVLPVTLDEFCNKFVPHHNYFDVVVFFDFLEHVVNPGEVLRMIKHILKKSGHIILRVPCTEDYPRIHLIDHIWYFSEKTILDLLAKEGFQVIDKHASGTFRSTDGEELQNITLFAECK